MHATLEAGSVKTAHENVLPSAQQPIELSTTGLYTRYSRSITVKQINHGLTIGSTAALWGHGGGRGPRRPSYSGDDQYILLEHPLTEAPSAPQTLILVHNSAKVVPLQVRR